MSLLLMWSVMSRSQNQEKQISKKNNNDGHK